MGAGKWGRASVGREKAISLCTSKPPRILAVQMCPRLGWPHAWHRFLSSVPSSLNLRPFSIRCHRLRTEETCAARSKAHQELFILRDAFRNAPSAQEVA